LLQLGTTFDLLPLVLRKAGLVHTFLWSALAVGLGRLLFARQKAASKLLVSAPNAGSRFLNLTNSVTFFAIFTLPYVYKL
jgi:hypothetical protein